MIQPIFIDIETTGLDPDQCDIIDVAIVNVDFSLIYKKRFNPRHDAVIEQGAVAVNGYDPKSWGRNPCFDEADAQEIHSIIKDKPLCGKNVHFDISFLKAQAPLLSWPHRYLDLTTLGWVRMGEILSSEGLSSALRVFPEDKPHTAHGGACWAANCYSILMRFSGEL